ncbi:hypothetical protein [Methylobacterium sp. PvR107]|uniref:HlyD family secretion protein n=1 Tax=Methylobacterium sp. PvR107 TaxID=2806597 RepID=UPI001B740679|nr:hypothetical protein [Methylobacterium sp. PvR107]MBP1179335.1 hypothetical protein [Methylobacterium sp. PvR107]
MVQAEGALAQARRNLERTTLRATVHGWVTNLLLQEGDFAATRQPAPPSVNGDNFWIEGYFEETQLPRIDEGHAARVSLMAWLDRPIRGRGISVADAAPGIQGLPVVNLIFTWVRLAKRVPVRIDLDDVPCPIVLAAGMTANVAILLGQAAPVAASAAAPALRIIGRTSGRGGPALTVAHAGGSSPSRTRQPLCRMDPDNYLCIAFRANHALDIGTYFSFGPKRPFSHLRCI